VLGHVVRNASSPTVATFLYQEQGMALHHIHGPTVRFHSILVGQLIAKLGVDGSCYGASSGGRGGARGTRRR
jgi:hypothetical protein